jgi:hypothetical protein
MSYCTRDLFFVVNYRCFYCFLICPRSRLNVALSGARQRAHQKMECAKYKHPAVFDFVNLKNAKQLGNKTK